MYYFKSFLKELSDNTGVPFNLIGKNGDVIHHGTNIDKDKEISIEISLSNNKMYLYMDREYKVCLALIKYYIEAKHEDLFYIRQQFFVDIFEGNAVPLDKFRKIVPFLELGCTLFLVSVDGSIYEAVNILKEKYSDKKGIVMTYKEDLLIIGNFYNKEEEAKDIRSIIINKLYCRCYVSYGQSAFNVNDIKYSYENAKSAMTIGRTLLEKSEIYNYDEMIFEKAIFNVNKEIKKEYIKEFKYIFDSFDEETLNTIEAFIKYNLNISDAAKNLYIHRNTLIYRLDKIYKDTGYDIRSFKDASVFNIAFLIWKEMK